MATNKKPKKRYVPRKTYYPNLVNQLNSFTPFEDALTRLLETGECEVDDFGNLTYRTATGVVQSFESTLRVYIQVVELCARRKRLEFDTRPLSLLQNRMFERKGFDEEEIEHAQTALRRSRILMSRMETLEIRDILTTVKTSIALDKTTDEDLSTNPEGRLAKYQRLAGKLSYEEVVARNAEYQLLAEGSSDPRIIETRDLYVRYLSAYNFYNREQAFKCLEGAIATTVQVVDLFSPKTHISGQRKTRR